MRQTREIGSDLILGDICYRLDAVVGQGSSAIVYRASYHDSLNRDILHQVLIKELFPASDGSIYRTASGHVASTEKGKAIMEQSERRFLIGNRINLQLLQKNVSGHPFTSRVDNNNPLYNNVFLSPDVTHHPLFYG